MLPLDHPFELGQELLLLELAKPGGVRPIADLPHRSWPIGVRFDVLRPTPAPPVETVDMEPFPQVPPDVETSDLDGIAEPLLEMVSWSLLLFPKLQVELRPNVLSIPAELDAAEVVAAEDAAARLVEELVFEREFISMGAIFTDPGVRFGSSLGSFMPFQGLPG